MITDLKLEDALAEDAPAEGSDQGSESDSGKAGE